jgi:hypothetical protein
MSFIIGWIVVFYVLPFLLIAAMPGWRSFGIAALVGTLALAMLWTNHLRHRFDTGGNGFASAMGEFALHMMTASLVASVIGRAVTLGWRDHLGTWRSAAVLAACFLAAPIWFHRAVF